MGEGAVAMVRLSGPMALAIAAKVYRGTVATEKLAPRRVYTGEIHDSNQKLDDVLLTYFRAPRSYTGEDVLEITCHGGVLVTRRILERFLSAGARMAGPGEFTQRAFLNGKMDLTQAEAVMDLIRAQTEKAQAAALAQMQGRLAQIVRNIRDRLVPVLAHLEVVLEDFDE